jgi:hypothetical protein
MPVVVACERDGAALSCDAVLPFSDPDDGEPFNGWFRCPMTTPALTAALPPASESTSVPTADRVTRHCHCRRRCSIVVALTSLERASRLRETVSTARVSRWGAPASRRRRCTPRAADNTPSCGCSACTVPVRRGTGGQG